MAEQMSQCVLLRSTAESGEAKMSHLEVVIAAVRNCRGRGPLSGLDAEEHISASLSKRTCLAARLKAQLQKPEAVQGQLQCDVLPYRCLACCVYFLECTGNKWLLSLSVGGGVKWDIQPRSHVCPLRIAPKGFSAFQWGGGRGQIDIAQ